MEVLDSVGPNGFLCHRCHHTLTREADRTSTGHEQSTRLNDQFKFISELLPKIDAVHIPECDFDRALAKARPVVRDATHQRAATIAVESGTNRPMAVKGLTNTGPQSIAVNISTSDGPSAAEKEAERARKEKIAQQNALPSWMSNSTVTGESFAGTLGGGATAAKQENKTEDVSTGKIVDINASAQIDDIFERLKAEQAAEMAKGTIQGRGEEDFDSEEDDDDDDEFEDVPATENTSSLGTPNIAAVKREASGAWSRDGDSADERARKKVKVEPEIKQEPKSDGGDESGEEDEDMEFEDI